MLSSCFGAFWHDSVPIMAKRGQLGGSWGPLEAQVDKSKAQVAFSPFGINIGPAFYQLNADLGLT